jgi:hypothetical protein
LVIIEITCDIFLQLHKGMVFLCSKQ